MSLVKFALCRRFLSARREVRSLPSLRTNTSSTVKKQKCFAESPTPDNYVHGCSYSTSVKPHMTQSLQKWKKRKRKSKAQQKKEMEKLQEDLVKLLTKRAVQLVKNKSLMGAQREVVTTHAFTTFSLGEDGEKEFLATSYLGPSALHPLNSRKRSDYVAQTVEAQLLAKLKGDSDMTRGISRAVVDDSGKQNSSSIDFSGSHSHAVSDGNRDVTNSHWYKSSAFGQLRDVNDIKSASMGDSVKILDIGYVKAISFSDLFREPVKQFSKTLTEHGPASFQSNLKRFKLDLEAAKTYYTSGNASSMHTWDEDHDNHSQPQSRGIIETTESTHTHKRLSSDIASQQLFAKENVYSEDILSHNISSSLQHQEEPLKMMNSDLSPSKHDWNQHGHLQKALTQEADEKPVNESDISLPSHFRDHQYQHTTEQHQSSMNIAKGSQTDTWTHPSIRIVSESAKVAPGGIKDASSQGRKSKKHMKHSKQKHQHMNVSRELQELNDKSFVEASCFTGNEMVAVRNLHYQASRHRITSVEVFSRLIHTLAKKQDLQTIKSLFFLIRQQELSPSLQTYAGCLECIGRMPDADIHLCEKLLDDIQRSGFELAEIANSCRFESDEWDHVLKAIRLVHPEFVPNPARLVTEYDNELLTGLNTPNMQALEKNQYALKMSKEDVCSWAAEQIEMEKRGEIVVESISTSSEPGMVDAKLREQRNTVLSQWRKVLCQSFEQKLATCERKAHDNVNMTLYPYLKLFTPMEYVDIIFKCLRELLSSSEGYSPTQSMIRSDLGRAVNRKYNIAAKVAAGMDEKVLKVYEEYMNSYLDQDHQLDNHRLMWLRAMNQHFDTINMDMPMRKWPAHIHKEIGKFLLEMILYDLKVDANLFRTRAPQRLVPAFCTIFRPDVSLYTNAEIKLHPVVTKLFKVDNSETFNFDPSIVPMIVPPVPWISKSMGGLLLGSNALVRMGADLHHVDILKTVKETQYPAVLDSLNTLSACAWKINKPILDLQIQIFNNKGDAHLKVAPPATELPPLPIITSEMTSKEKALLYRERLQLQQQKQDMHGLWCTDLYRLSIANKFREKIFWFPHSMDFRGRTYPLPPHFNHLGSDNVRGMLLFAKGKPLGEKGYDWLKIHLINLTGFKKRSSNEERLQYADSLMSEILDSADRPLTGNRWWQTSDEPWQTLACCMEIANIERYEGNTQDYVCHFPVHQDGSCNGLQHYAALGRDQAGAESVNLHPFDTPQDVYSDVVELVEKARQKDAETGNETAQALEGFIKRKVIKQTIMTTVYGVTRYGAKLQIHRQLKDIQEFPAEHAWKASLYLTDTTFNCLREMFTATKDIQDWLTESARYISAFSPVDWVTPLGFPVLQAYYKRLSKVESKHDQFKPNTMKQKNAFPPNYIHSLDSTHMMLTALYCMHAGITYVSVHDCFWTHACDVPVMNKICREQFVKMHNQPLLEELSDHLVALVKRATSDPNLKEDMKTVDVPALLRLLSDVPKRGSFDLDNVLKSTYFFS